MKIKYIFIASVLLPVTQAMVSCVYDDPVEIVEEEEPTEILFGAESAKVQVGGDDVIVPIINGEGQYTVYSLNPEIAEVYRGNDGNYYITGVKNGITDLLVADASDRFCLFPVTVYTNPSIELSATTLSMTPVLGKRDESIEVSISSGNGDYVVETDNDNITAKILYAGEATDNPILEVSALGRLNRYTSTITVTDASGFTNRLEVDVDAIKTPFSQEDFDKLCSKNENDAFIDCSATPDWHLSLEWEWTNRQEEFWINEEAEGIHTFGFWVSYSEQAVSGHKVTYPAGTATGQEVPGNYIWRYTTEDTYSVYTLPGTVKILRDDAKGTVVVWWNVNEEKEYLEKGYIVKVP